MAEYGICQECGKKVTLRLDTKRATIHKVKLANGDRVFCRGNNKKVERTLEEENANE